jgi:hypothetical protein
MQLPHSIPDIPRWWTQTWFKVTSAILLIVSIGLIFYQLGQVPHGMTWDEAAIGYNGYAVITKRRDEWLHKLPISFKSFGDYKAPLAIYVNGLFTYGLGDVMGLGMELWIIRLPFALAGVGTVIGTWLLLTELWPKPNQGQSLHLKHVAILIGTTTLVTSPWFLHFARTGFESGMALMWLCWGSWALLKLFKTPTGDYKRLMGWVLLTAGCLVAGMYTYHSSKLVVPLVALLLVLWQRRHLVTHGKWVVGVAIISLVGLYPLLSDSLYGHGADRFGQSSVFSQLQTVGPAGVSKTIVNNFSQHLTYDFLVRGETPTLRHGAGEWGVLLPTTLLLALVGVAAAVILPRKPANDFLRQLSWLGLGWWLVGLLPAAIGVDVPHSNRALLALPGVVILAAVGYATLQQLITSSSLNQKITGSHGEKNTIWYAVLGSWWLFHSLFFVAYLHHYYTDFARQSAVDFKDGYLETLAFVVPYEKGKEGHTKVDQVVFTNDYGQAYIYTLLARQTDPIWYQGGALNTYLFTDQISVSDLERPNTIVVASGADDLPLERATKVVLGSDGEVKFKIYVNQE